METDTEKALFRGVAIWQWATRDCEEEGQVKVEGVCGSGAHVQT